MIPNNSIIGKEPRSQHLDLGGRRTRQTIHQVEQTHLGQGQQWLEKQQLGQQRRPKKLQPRHLQQQKLQLLLRGEAAAAAERDVLDVPPLEVEPPPPSPPSTSTRRYAILKKHYNLCN